MLASVPINRAARQLQDTGATRWTAAVLLDYCNEAIRKIVSAKPEQHRTRATRQLTAALSSQSVPTGCIAYFGPKRNMGSDGTTAGAVIRGPVDREALDAFTANWMTTPSTTIKEWTQVSPFEPTFLVNPPVHGTTAVYVEEEYTPEPTTLTASSDTLPVSADHEAAIVEWILGRSYGEETEEGSVLRSETCFKRFWEMMA